jgi:hypothetical protein
MGHLHTSSGCACCEGMGSAYTRPIFERDRPAQKEARVDTLGMEHLYEAVEVVETAVVAQEVVEPVSGGFAELVKEQAAKLESASYRIGYLEAQLQSKEEQIKLLTTSKKKTWWQWFIQAS